MSALAIAQAIKCMIEIHVDATTFILQDLREGDNGIWVQNASEYRPGETIVLKNNDKAETHKVRCVDVIEEIPVILLCEPITAPFAFGAWVKKTHNKQTIQEIVIGNPDHIDNYPAITIEASTMQRQPFTLGTVSDTFSIDIGVWMDATNYSDAYETLLIITDKVENALFKQISPLVEPYFSTVLLEDIEATDTVVRVENSQLANGSFVFFENARGVKRQNRITANLDAGVLELAFGNAFAYKKGDVMIHPLVHIYDPRIESITYDDAFDNDHLLKSSTITYTAKLQKLRQF